MIALLVVNIVDVTCTLAVDLFRYESESRVREARSVEVAFFIRRVDGKCIDSISKLWRETIELTEGRVERRRHLYFRLLLVVLWAIFNLRRATMAVRLGTTVAKFRKRKAPDRAFRLFPPASHSHLAIHEFTFCEGFVQICEDRDQSIVPQVSL